MSRQEKSITEKHAKILRELVKRSENKVCADCKRNDPRWASWNIGVFLCIRCSGIHRSMGTHISKIKSIDLDIWTPEQMESIQKWGNTRANLYWEAHLKAGHVPPDHKMESFIRSKYESRRWALEGPVPKDPSVLENGSARQDTSSPPPPPPVSQKSTTTLPPPPSTSTSSHTAQRQTITPRPLLSSQTRSLPAAPLSPPPAQQKQSQPAAQAAQQPATAPQNDLFSLDFHSPPPGTPQPQTTSSQPQRNVKDDILSLFSAPPPAGTGVLGGGGGSGAGAFGNANPAAISMVGNTGTGMWGAQSGWNGVQAMQSPQQANIWGPPPQTNAWSQPFQQQQSQQPFGAFGGVPAANTNMASFGTQDIWSNAASPSLTTAGVGGQTNDLFGGSFAAAAPQQKKDDAFGDIWGSFK